MASDQVVTIHGSSVSAAAGDQPGRRALGKEPSRDYSIDVLASPMLTFAIKKLSTDANGQKEDAPIPSRSESESDSDHKFES